MTTAAPSRRSAGVLLHVTSLPSPFGIGDLGPEAYAWVDSLVHADLTWWQTLPLGPTGYGDSPYQSFSSFAGNPCLVSPQRLIDDGLLKPEDVAGVNFPPGPIDFGRVIPFKFKLLDRAWQAFRKSTDPALKKAYDQFVTTQTGWLDDYTLFMAIKDHHQGARSSDWLADLARRESSALTAARKTLAERIDQHRFRQFIFYRQWSALKTHANQRGLRLIGDVPIFVSGDSADLWGHPELFLLDKDYSPLVVAGVPPDYFSPTGQRWGNPLYDWDALKKTGYAWWIARLKATLAHFDVVRLDHFRGFESAWHIPAEAPTAQNGQWEPGPGADFFVAVQKALGGLPLLAEDLGDITPAVRQLRDQFNLAGMRILQFAFGNQPENLFLPHNYVPNTVVYTGTHDNDTTRGWYDTLGYHDKQFIWRFLGKHYIDSRDIAWELIRMAWASVANYALVPLQDLLNLDTRARMNLPGREGGNWQWRITPDQPVEQALQGLRDFNWLYYRRRDKY
jgi:4-alpha-glucanotransferase